MEEGGGGRNASGNRDTISPYLLGHKVGNSGAMGGLTTYLQ